jgi:hypothetical protein
LMTLALLMVHVCSQKLKLSMEPVLHWRSFLPILIWIFESWSHTVGDIHRTLESVVSRSLHKSEKYHTKYNKQLILTTHEVSASVFQNILWPTVIFTWQIFGPTWHSSGPMHNDVKRHDCTPRENYIMKILMKDACSLAQILDRPITAPSSIHNSRVVNVRRSCDRPI